MTEGSDVVRGERFSGGPARGFLSSMDADERIFEADLAVDRAHVVMLAERGIVEESSAGSVLDGLAAVEEAGYDRLSGEDVHAAIESAVIDRVGPDGGRMHTARSRNDEVATCLRYRFREDLLDTIDATLALRAALLESAREHVDTLMPGYTHRQPAQPTTVGHFLASYEEAFARDTERLVAAYDRTNRSPLGAAAFAGTPFDVDRERTAELLGFDGLVENSMDAVSTRDFLVEGASALASLSVSLSGLATDLVEFASDGYLDVDDDYASTSSIMPQKKNPDSLELVRAAAGDATAGLNGLLTTLKGLPRAYNRDLQTATPHAWAAVDAVVPATEVAAGAVATATWEEEALADAASGGFSTATGVADLLAMAGLPFRTAHEILARAAHEIEDGAAVEYATVAAAAEEVLDDSLDSYVERESVERALDPEASVASRDSFGGPAPASVEAALDRREATFEDDEGALADRRARLDSAADALDTEVARYG
ncbi:argininosuccinate lyase [Halococcus hamelinensis]|uniref:Argininosuccinate lyase n=2 Tax=Halococcus hamelinensis TaxID=332168 RepID=M0M322_9EURY|nr:argininosuccinate lyase [Halococcus hamelinensis]EMA40217.1 argininosuccinate lyase [Halococcus hamelinensis 100A6]